MPNSVSEDLTTLSDYEWP